MKEQRFAGFRQPVTPANPLKESSANVLLQGFELPKNSRVAEPQSRSCLLEIRLFADNQEELDGVPVHFIHVIFAKANVRFAHRRQICKAYGFANAHAGHTQETSQNDRIYDTWD